MKKVLIVIGTRPNFIKVTQFKKMAEKFDQLEIVIAHTGQHFDDNMSKVFFQQFGLIPDHFLNVPSGAVCTQLANIIQSIDTLVEEITPSMILAVGDVNSTLCASIVANKRNIPLGHIESGLRSFDRGMPEEHNRVITDHLADHFFVTEQSGLDNLRLEGKTEAQICFSGNTMIDTLVAFQEEIEQSDVLERLQIESGKFVLMTMHRPSNVDEKGPLLKVVELVEGLAANHAVVFPIHPRTLKRLESYGLKERIDGISNLIQLPPLDYFAFQKLIAHAKLVITDSGGIQEETTFKQVPCLTIRENTERPITIDQGTNELVAFDVELILSKVNQEAFKTGKVPELWDGQSTERILAYIDQLNFSA